MVFVHEALLALVGCGAGFWLFSVVALPLCYGIPSALVGWKRGQLSLKPAFLYLGIFLLWNALFLVAFIVLSYFPSALETIKGRGGFSIGTMIGFGVTALRSMFSGSARKGMRADFDAFVRPYSKSSPN